MNPTISALMSVHNQGKYLSQAISSLKKQTLPAAEYIFIDDASTDNSWAILKKNADKHTFLFHNDSRQGLAACLNQGISYAKGHYLARMDADDIAHPHRFSQQINFLKKHHHVVACGTAVTLIDKNSKKIGQKISPSHPEEINAVIMKYNPIVHPTVMMRTSIIKEVGGYDEELNGAEDYDLWLRLNAKYPLANLSEMLLQYRLNPKGVSWEKLKHVEKQAIKARLKAIRQYHYPKSHLLYLAKPLISYLIPAKIKKFWFNIS